MALVLSETRAAIGICETDPLPNGNFLRLSKVDDVLGRHSVKILSEQITLHGGNTATVRQFILGHHIGAYASNWKKHQGWQGDESIREFYMRKIEADDSILTREFDVSQREYIFS